MKEEFYDLDPRTNLDLIKKHEEEYDQVYVRHMLPFSTAENFQYSLEHKVHPKYEFIVKFNKQKESMLIISTVDDARCHLTITETQLRYHLGTISLQRFADSIVSLEVKTGLFSRYKTAVSEKFSIEELNDSTEARFRLEILVNMRYAASKSPAVYHQLKDASSKY